MIKKTPKIAVLFMGKPGAGKGTQADLLAEKYGLIHFNTGEVIRHRLANPQTAEDRREKKIYNSGKLNTFSWVAALVCQSAHKYSEEGRGIVFSGSPRSLYEAERLAPQLINDYGRENVIAIVLDIDDQTAITRNSGRLTCDKCGFTMTPALELSAKTIGEPCPKCGGKLIRRPIDNPEVIAKKRLPQYYQETLPVIGYLRQLRIAREIDGRRTIEEVKKDVWEIVKKMK